MKSSYYSIRDLAFRLILKITSSHHYSQSEGLISDSQKSKYQETIDEILNDSRMFQNFRRNLRYREILEHVDFRLGKKYLNQIKIRSNRMKIDLNWNRIKINDSIGNPILFKYPESGRISPTTLRYTSVALEIQEIFGTNMKSIAEIGAGYGGQLRILDELFNLESYDCFDLPEVQKLIERYVERIPTRMRISFPQLDVSSEKNWDLVISNYAFSELPHSLQEQYINKVLLKSKCGFMIMNSGLSNKTGRSLGKYSAFELLKIIPNSQIHEETPLTGPDNYILIWENRNK